MKLTIIINQPHIHKLMDVCDMTDRGRKRFVLAAELTIGDPISAAKAAEKLISSFKDELVAVCGTRSPLYINPNVESVSDGDKWCRLADFLQRRYPRLTFTYDNYYMNVQVKGTVSGPLNWRRQ